MKGMPMRSMSTNIASANIKALRLFRYICRMTPFILKVHEVYYIYDIGTIDLMTFKRRDSLPIISEGTHKLLI